METIAKHVIIKVIKLICIGIITCCLFWFLCYAYRSIAKHEAIKCFNNNRDVFEQVAINNKSADHSILTAFRNLFGVLEIDVPERLNEAGIVSIFASNGNIYFEFAHSNLGTTPYGIIYIVDMNEVDEWYKTDLIQNEWYYYRIVS